MRRLLHDARLPAAILHLHYRLGLITVHSDGLAATLVDTITREQLTAALLVDAKLGVRLTDLRDVLVGSRLNDSLIALSDWLDTFELAVVGVVHDLLLRVRAL